MSRLGRGFPNNALMRVPTAIAHVSYDATGAGSQAGTASFTINIGPAANLVLCATGTTASGAGSQSITVGGVAMTAVPNASGQYYSNGVNDAGQIGLFSLFNPPTGNQTVTITLGGGLYLATVNAVSYCGVASLGTAAYLGGNSATASQSATGGDQRGFVFHALTSYATPTSYNQNQRYLKSVSGNSHSLLLGDAMGQTAPTFSAPLSSSTVWGSVAVPLIPFTH